MPTTQPEEQSDALRMDSPPSLHALLPPAAVERVKSFLCITTLMDMRACSRQLQRWCEDAAVRWLTLHVTDAAYRVRSAADRASLGSWVTRRTKAGRSVRGDIWLNGRALGCGDDCCGAVPLSSHGAIVFTRHDAAWFRRQVDRWSHAGQPVEDALLCRVDLQYARTAYGCRPHSKDLTGLGVAFPTFSFRVVDVMLRLCKELKGCHAAGRLRALASESEVGTAEAQESSAAVALRREAETARWMRSSAGTTVLHGIPATVFEHCALPFLELDTLLELRRCSRGLQSLAERAACEWMNWRFPAGLATIARRCAVERQEDGGKVKPIELFGRARPPSTRVSVMRRRDGSAVSAYPLSSPPAVVSFDVDDVLWLRQQLSWGQQCDLTRVIRKDRGRLAAERGNMYMVRSSPVRVHSAFSHFRLESNSTTSTLVLPTRPQYDGGMGVWNVIDVTLEVYGHCPFPPRRTSRPARGDSTSSPSM